MQGKSIAIVGTVGVPANYGGFETLAGNLVKHHDAASLPDPITVYCSSRSYPLRERSFFLRGLNMFRSMPMVRRAFLMTSFRYSLRFGIAAM
jgi:hypothetical protein